MGWKLEAGSSRSSAEAPSLVARASKAVRCVSTDVSVSIADRGEVTTHDSGRIEAWLRLASTAKDEAKKMGDGDGVEGRLFTPCSVLWW